MRILIIKKNILIVYNCEMLLYILCCKKWTWYIFVDRRRRRQVFEKWNVIHIERKDLEGDISYLYSFHGVNVSIFAGTQNIWLIVACLTNVFGTNDGNFKLVFGHIKAAPQFVWQDINCSRLDGLSWFVMATSNRPDFFQLYSFSGTLLTVNCSHQSAL